MDTTTVISLIIAVIAGGIAWFFILRARSLAATVDDAMARIGGKPPKRAWHRQEALNEALERLERSTLQAQRDRSQLAGALQAAEPGVVITDDHGVVTFANPTAGQFLEASEGNELAESRVSAAIEQAMLNRATVTVELALETPVRRTLEITALPLDFGVQSVGAVAFIADATDERMVEAIRRDFIANVNHELRTPLSTLAAMADTIANHITDESVAQQMAERLRGEANRINTLVDNLLDLSQAQAMAGTDSPIQAAHLIDAVTTALTSTARESRVELIGEDVGPHAKVTGDERQLRSMLEHLVDNAVKFSAPVEGQAPPHVWLRSRVHDNEVVFEVQDEGIGISEADLDRVFERFYRVDRERDKPAGGVGLGLSIVRHIALAHKGEISVESTPGEGTVFRVRLPLWKT